MELFTATISSFNEIEKIDLGYRYIINENDYKRAICIEHDNELIDIETLEKYYLLKRSERGTLAKEEFCKIRLGVRYALNAEPVDKLTIPVALKAKKALLKTKHAQKTLKR